MARVRLLLYKVRVHRFQIISACRARMSFFNPLPWHHLWTATQIRKIHIPYGLMFISYIMQNVQSPSLIPRLSQRVPFITSSLFYPHTLTRDNLRDENPVISLRANFTQKRSDKVLGIRRENKALRIKHKLRI